MIGALVNIRRGGRSPPLLMVALVTCILLFGFNYWASSSRNVELQTKLLELEEAMRRVSVERAREQVGRSEAEEQVRMQAEQLAHQEGAHQRRQQSAQNVWNQERESLLLNISTTAKTLQEMKSMHQMKSVREDLGKVQKELKSCQSNMNTLNKKLTYDMTQCNTQILAQKEECNEKLTAAKLEMQKKYQKQNAAAAAAVQSASDSTQKAVFSKPVADALASNDSTKSAVGPGKSEPAPETEPERHEPLETNEIPQDEAVQVVNNSDKPESPSTLLLANPNSTPNSLTDNIEGVMDIKGEDSKAADADVNDDEAIEYNNENEIEKRLSNLKGGKAGGQDFEEELADYNGDEENEPELEADKQAELAKV